ncbi:TPA: hypothetical protein GXZ54_03465, partial [bacterium]|nr:hypothetical protein [bacterium]
FFMTIEHKYETFFLTMHTFLCSVIKGHLEIKEHINSRWLPKDELLSLDWAAADLPIVLKLIEVL